VEIVSTEMLFWSPAQPPIFQTAGPLKRTKNPIRTCAYFEVMLSNYRPIGKTVTITPVESGNLNLNKLVSPWMSA